MSDAPVTDPDAPAALGHWFEDLAEHMGPSYLRYSFTKGTAQEVAFLTEVTGVGPGDRLLDVGCGPGRHTLAFAGLGVLADGLDISQTFVDLGNDAARERALPATFRRDDARALAVEGDYDVVLSLCQGGFGLLGREDDGAADGDVLARMARALKPGGVLVLSAFSAYFQLRHLESSDTFDAETGVNHEATEVLDANGRSKEADLWTTCFTPRELRLLAERAGLTVDAVWSVTPGSYARTRPVVDLPEFLLLAHRAAD